MNDDSPYFSLQEAAAYARCSERTVRRWIEASKLTRYGHGKRVLVRRDQLMVLLTEQPEAEQER